jgi:hypothetical protein
MLRSPPGSMKDSTRTTTLYPDSETLEIGELALLDPHEANYQVLLVVILTCTWI